MVSPGDNMAQTESEEEHPMITYGELECKNCGHRNGGHWYREGCNEISNDSDPEVGVFHRCHCTNFEVKE